MAARDMASGCGLKSLTDDDVLLYGGSRRDPADDSLFANKKDDDLWFFKTLVCQCIVQCSSS